MQVFLLVTQPTTTLPQVIFSYAWARVKPSVYAAATLLMAAVSLGISGVSAAPLRRQRRLAREIKAALPTLAQQIFPDLAPAR